MKKKICLLEDDQDIREIISLLLKDDNYEVNAFGTIKDFLKASRVYTPDLYLLDVMLPDGNGITLCRKINNDQNTKNIPVIMMSAAVSSRQIGVGCKAKLFVAKPFDVDHLMDSVKIALRS